MAQKQPVQNEELFERVSSWLHREHSSEDTISTYEMVARQYDNYRGLDNVTTENITNYLIEDLTDVKESTRELHYHALKSIQKALKAFGKVDSDDVDWDVIPKPKANGTEPRALPEDDVKTLIDHAHGSLHDEAVIRLGYDLALRVKEASNVERRDVDLDEGEVLIHGVKAREDQTWPISDGTQEALERWIKALGPEPHTQLFKSPSTIQRRFRSIGLEADIADPDEEFGFHVLRHSRCANLLRNGWDVETVRDFAGHSSIDTTQRYLRFVEEERKEMTRNIKNKLDNETSGL